MRFMWLCQSDDMPLVVIKNATAEGAKEQLLKPMNGNARKRIEQTLKVEKLTIELLDQITEGDDFEGEFSIIPSTDF